MNCISGKLVQRPASLIVLPIIYETKFIVWVLCQGTEDLGSRDSSIDSDFCISVGMVTRLLHIGIC